MKNELNLVEVLKYAPIGTKLYSTIYGEVEYVNIGFGNTIVCKVVNGDKSFEVEFHSNGRKYENGEVVLFPAKNKKNWTNYKIYNFNSGDYVVMENGFDKWICIFKEYKPLKQELYYYVGSYSLTRGDESSNSVMIESHYDVGLIDNVRLATENEKTDLINLMCKSSIFFEKTTLKVNDLFWEIGDVLIDQFGGRYIISGIDGETQEYIANWEKGDTIKIPFVKQSLFIRSDKHQKVNCTIPTEGGGGAITFNNLDKKLKPFDKVLVTYDNIGGEWHINFFSHYDEKNNIFNCVSGPVVKCIPYNDNTKHLLMTNSNTI